MPRRTTQVAVRNLAEVAAEQRAKPMSKAQKEELRDRVADLRLQGLTFREIATACGCSVTSAYDQYKAVEERWRKNAMTSMNTIKAKELAKLDLIEHEAWNAYQRSQEDKVEIRQEFMHEGASRVQTGTSAKRITQIGDARWLQVILDCVDRRAKLLGLTRDEMVGPVRGAVAIDHDHNAGLDERLAKYIGVLGFAVGVVEGAIAGQQRAGESVDSARPTPETGRVLDADARVRDTAS